MKLKWLKGEENGTGKISFHSEKGKQPRDAAQMLRKIYAAYSQAPHFLPILPLLTWQRMNKSGFCISLQDRESSSNANPYLFLQKLRFLHSIVGWSFPESFFLFYNLYQRGGDTSSEVFLNYFCRQDSWAHCGGKQLVKRGLLFLWQCHAPHTERVQSKGYYAASGVTEILLG